ncbi:CotH kinase family protein [Hoylesella enoeca]|uniref:Spore coat protein CotH n=2 Tax=Hoylesella enoeca TaxID=76123 RepID=A0A0S2KIC4_9BACT|nr:CotH kinase family protein [Hoylesella enoeca]ALO48055.1 hypothetical protein AS203_02230 [Hoylesella enoeca]
MKINIFSLVVISGLLTFTASCSSDDMAHSADKASADHNKKTRLTVFVARGNGSDSGTRTSFDYASGRFFWDAGDRIYVRDDSGTFQTSSNTVTNKNPLFTFMMPGTYATDGYVVYYPGTKGHDNQVTIADKQVQSIPYTTKHFGDAGDCGMGITTRNASGQLEFRINHKAAYLCFQPYAKYNRVSTYITAIEVTSDDNIAGTYWLDPVDEKLKGVGDKRTIMLTTKGQGDDDNGLPLKNAAPALRENGAFMVIAPGTHQLTVKYHIQNVLTHAQGVITKKLQSFDYQPNTYYDVKSQLDITDLEAHVSIPRIDINIDGGAFVTDKTTYLNALFKISGIGSKFDMAEPVQIKGRGNSSWNAANPYDKNPYCLKFSKAVAPFGLARGKNWVLLANKQPRSMMANAVGMKLASLVQTVAPNHIIPVELYINGEYRGSYTLTEKVGLSDNSVKLKDKSKAALLELDTYYDEELKFRSSFYDLPVNIKDSKDKSPQMVDLIRTDFDRLCSTLKNGESIAHLVDVDQLARYLMVNELLCNYELMHPKSTYLYKEDFTSPDGKYIFGPVWDLDWTLGYETNRNYGTSDPKADFWHPALPNYEHQQFMRDLRFKDKAVREAYYRVWKEFMEHHLQELLIFCDEYIRYVRSSFLHNNTRWNKTDDYMVISQHMKVWLQRRANHIYSQLTS